jgi:hypothetical protein
MNMIFINNSINILIPIHFGYFINHHPHNCSQCIIIVLVIDIFYKTFTKKDINIHFNWYY